MKFDGSQNYTTFDFGHENTIKDIPLYPNFNNTVMRREELFEEFDKIANLFPLGYQFDEALNADPPYPNLDIFQAYYRNKFHIYFEIKIVSDPDCSRVYKVSLRYSKNGVGFYYEKAGSLKRIIEWLNDVDMDNRISPFVRWKYGGKLNNNYKGLKKVMMINKEALKIKKVEWNIQKKTGYPCTVVYWDDGTVTSVICNTDTDTFSVEVGIMACYMKKIFGNNGHYNQILHKYEKQFVKDGWNEKIPRF